LQGEGGEDRRLGLREKDDLREPLVGQVLEVIPFQLYCPSFLSDDAGRVHHGPGESGSGIREHLLRRLAVGPKHDVCGMLQIFKGDHLHFCWG